MPLTRHRELQLNEQECFDLWLEVGSLAKVSQRLAKDGKLNQLSGEPFTIGGIRNASMRYIIYNPDDAYAKMKAVDPTSMYLRNTDTWYKYLTHKAREVFSNRSRESDIFDWAIEFGIPKEYVDAEVHR